MEGEREGEVRRKGSVRWGGGRGERKESEEWRQNNIKVAHMKNTHNCVKNYH